MKIDSAKLAKELYFKSLLKKEVTKKGNFIDYKFYSNSKYQIIWGNKRFTNVFRDTFYTTNPANVPTLSKDTLDYLILFYGCGTDCTIDIFLNTNDPKISESFYNLKDYNLEEGIFVYQGVSKEESIVVKNIKTGNTFTENLDEYLEPLQRPIFDAIYYEKGYLIYELNKLITKTGMTIKKKIKVNFNKA